MSNRKLSLASIALVAALAVAGCGGGGGGGDQASNTPASPGPSQTPAPAPTPSPSPTPSGGEDFGNWAKSQVFPLQADGAPVIMDELVFTASSLENSDFSDLFPAEGA